MATVGQDSFTESSNTDLPSHTPDVGSGWTVETASDFLVIASSDDLSHRSTTMSRARKGDDIGSDQMVVSCRGKVSNNVGRLSGVCARMSNDNFTNQYEAYFLRNSTTVTDVLLFKNVGGTRTQLGS